MNHVGKTPAAKVIPLVALSIIGGVAMGYGIRSAMDRDIALPEEAKDISSLTVVSPAAPVRDEAAASEIAALRTRVRELESQLSDAAREGGGAPVAEADSRDPARFRQPPPDSGTNAPPPRRHFSSPGEWLENLKKENPERYAEVVRRSQEMRQRMKEHSQTRNEFLSTLVTDKSSETLKANHAKLVETLAVVEGYQERMGPDSDNPLTDEERQAFWETSRTLRELMEVERRGALEELGADYGENGADFADYIEAIYQNTNGRWPMGGPPPGGRGDRWGGGRRQGGPR